MTKRRWTNPWIDSVANPNRPTDMKDDLNKTLKEITFALGHDYRYDPDEPARETLKAGPNDWDNLESSDFGPEHDFELYDHGSLWVFWPVSNAALQWCYRFLPEDCPRWGSKGFAIEARYIENVVKGAQKDNLMSEQDWIDANEEAANQAVQWEE